MTEITDVKSRIIQLSPAMFEEFCSTLLYKEGHQNIYEIGIKAATVIKTVAIHFHSSLFKKSNIP